jgi:hypothetical protein
VTPPVGWERLASKAQMREAHLYDTPAPPTDPAGGGVGDFGVGDFGVGEVVVGGTYVGAVLDVEPEALAGVMGLPTAYRLPVPVEMKRTQE